jgi:hypothetical protein
MKKNLKYIARHKDLYWFIIYLLGVSFLYLWNAAFLNSPSLHKIESGVINTFAVVSISILFSFALAFINVNLVSYFDIKRKRSLKYAAGFMQNLIRSVPQIVGVLFSYIAITDLIKSERVTENYLFIFLMAFSMSLFVYYELYDVFIERIEFYKKNDFFNAMRCCGISEFRIINYDILFKNSAASIFNKLIALSGTIVFLQCSVDFVISIGLSKEINATDLPVTLGGLLASLDSKQDILAIGHSLTSPSYFPSLFFEHLQGITVAFLITFTLFSLFKISGAYAKRKGL